MMEKIKVKVIKAHEDAVIPTYGTPEAAGFDLYSVEDVTLTPTSKLVISTGLKMEIPPGYELQVRPRSGMTVKTDFRVANSPGTIDSDYRGIISIIGHHVGSSGNYIHIKKGDRIAQGVIAPIQQAQFEVAEELSETERGDGGFGSTGQ